MFLEVGPGRTLASLVRQAAPAVNAASVVTSLRHPQESTADESHLLTALGRLWLAGIDVEWGSLSAGERRRRVPLPTYPFERQRYWIEDGCPRGPGP